MCSWMKTFGATWAGNRKDDIVWGRKDTIIPPRGLQAQSRLGWLCAMKGRVVRTNCPRGLDPLTTRWCANSSSRFHKDTYGENLLFQDNDPSHRCQQTDNAGCGLSVRGRLQVPSQLWRSEPSRESMVDSAHQHGGSEDYDTCFVWWLRYTERCEESKGSPCTR